MDGGGVEEAVLIRAVKRARGEICLHF